MRRPRRAGGVVLVAASAALAGCLARGPAAGPAGWLDRVRGVGGGGPAAGLAIETELIDRPAGDPYLSRGLWAAAGKPVPHEQATLLAHNGVRVGVVAGMLPGEFERLIRSDQAAVSPMLRTAKPGAAQVVPVNGPLEACGYGVLPDLAAARARVDLAGAECGLAVTARPADGGRVHLRCEPRVQHGDKQAWLNPTADGAGWARQDRKPLEAYPTLGWEVTLGPGEFLVVGPTESPAGTLGGAFFLAGDADRPRQRVLVIHARRGPGSTDGGNPVPTPRPPPAAAQAVK